MSPFHGNQLLNPTNPCHHRGGAESSSCRTCIHLPHRLIRLTDVLLILSEDVKEEQDRRAVWLPLQACFRFTRSGWAITAKIMQKQKKKIHYLTCLRQGVCLKHVKTAVYNMYYCQKLWSETNPGCPLIILSVSWDMKPKGTKLFGTFFNGR